MTVTVRPTSPPSRGVVVNGTLRNGVVIDHVTIAIHPLPGDDGDRTDVLYVEPVEGVWAIQVQVDVSAANPTRTGPHRVDLANIRLPRHVAWVTAALIEVLGDPTPMRAPDIAPCTTLWSGRTLDEPCDQCGHMLVQHTHDPDTYEKRCLVCWWLAVETVR